MNEKIRISSPTKLGERNDSAGCGYYGAKRGARKHYGRDYEGKPGQDVFCPIDSGKIVRFNKPYVGDLDGVDIEGEHISIRLFYVKVFPHMLGAYVKRWDSIGTMQDVSIHYSDNMTPHVHLRIDSIDPEMLENGTHS